MNVQFRRRLLASSLFVGAATMASPALAQNEPVVGQDATDAVDESDVGEDIVVTGSRIARPNLEANSPIAVVTGEETVENADITLDTFLNTLPQVNPAGTTTSNNPGNAGQSNINLRGLGSNRNLILIDGRRPMVSASDQTVDLNTIPQGLVERIEVVTGGAGAAYGADAIAGVVNIRLREDFEGVDLRATYTNTIPELDSREYQISGVLGGNFADGRGNMALAVEYSDRQSLVKSQRAFAAQATSTTGTPPVGRYLASAANPIPQAAIDAIFASYGVTADQAPQGGSQIGFNTDGTLFGVGIFNNPRDVANFQYDISSPANPNTNFFPDFYSYNFDIINFLVLPLERKSAFLRGNYEISPSFDVFVQAGYTEYTSADALAPTPVGTTIINPALQQIATQATSELVANAINPATGNPRTITGIIAPITNPFIPADLAALLAQRTGDDPALTGSGATEGVRISKRFLDTGLRQSTYENTVLQGLIGVRGDISDNWRYEAYYSYGETTIDRAAAGNVNVQRVQELLESPTGGTDLCEGGFNPFGINPLSDECIEYIDETGFTSTMFTQKVAQAYVTGDLVELPAGALSIVAGVEKRDFRYEFDPGVLFGPIAGFNTSTPDLGTNSFLDFFGELLVPIARNQPWAETLEFSLTARHSRSDFNDIANGIDGDPQSSWAYGATLSYAPISEVRLRAGYQRSVRAPNFGELFSGGSAFPQYFDPCSITSNFRASGGDAARALCLATGVSTPDAYVQTPGSQAFVGISGNTGLEPEESETFTVGGVFQALGFTGSIDYYNIKIQDPIFAPDPNLLIAACYGYHGINPNLDQNNVYCGSTDSAGAYGSIFTRTPDIASITIPAALGGDDLGYFQSVNQGSIKTSGIDLQLAYRLPTEFVGESSALSFNLLVNYLIDFKLEELPGIVIDYAGTASYFGADLGSSFPEWKGNLNVDWTMDPITLSARVRYIHEMENRAAVQFPGEEFTGPGSIWYFDFAVQAEIENLTWRIGLNNAFDRDPPQYAPNVQSGTDPSLYDILGRRAYVSARLKF